MIKKFKKGMWYRWTGPVPATFPSSWNTLMGVVFDGKWRRCLDGLNHYAILDGVVDADGYNYKWAWGYPGNKVPKEFEECADVG